MMMIILVFVELIFINNESNDVILRDWTNTTSSELTTALTWIVVIWSNYGTFETISIWFIIVFVSMSITTFTISIIMAITAFTVSVVMTISTITTLTVSIITIIVVIVCYNEDCSINVTDVVVNEWRTAVASWISPTSTIVVTTVSTAIPIVIMIIITPLSTAVLWSTSWLVFCCCWFSFWSCLNKAKDKIDLEIKKNLQLTL